MEISALTIVCVCVLKRLCDCEKEEVKENDALILILKSIYTFHEFCFERVTVYCYRASSGLFIKRDWASGIAK